MLAYIEFFKDTYTKISRQDSLEEVFAGLYDDEEKKLSFPAIFKQYFQSVVDSNTKYNSEDTKQQWGKLVELAAEVKKLVRSLKKKLSDEDRQQNIETIHAKLQGRLVVEDPQRKDVSSFGVELGSSSQ